MLYLSIVGSNLYIVLLCFSVKVVHLCELWVSTRDNRQLFWAGERFPAPCEACSWEKKFNIRKTLHSSFQSEVGLRTRFGWLISNLALTEQETKWSSLDLWFLKAVRIFCYLRTKHYLFNLFWPIVTYFTYFDLF